MAKGFTISLSGLQKTLSNLEKQGDKILDECDDELAAGAQKMATDAKRACPVDTGKLRAAISASPVKKLVWEIAAQTTYAAYVEFGTGKYVKIPAGTENFAAQFKGRGIRQVNRNAKPYFFPAIFNNRPKVVQELVRVIKKKREI